MPITPNCPSVPNAPPSNFMQLVTRIQAGDERALERLLAAAAAPMRHMADLYIGTALQPHVDAEDLVQRASLILWHGMQSGKFQIATPKQLMGLARTLLKRQAARAAQQFKPAMAATAEFDLGATVVDQRVMPVSCPVKKAEGNEKIQQLMKRVSDDDRRMLELLLQGHSIAAAGRVLQIEPATLRKRLSRLRVRIRTAHHVRVTVRRTPPTDASQK